MVSSTKLWGSLIGLDRPYGMPNSADDHLDPLVQQGVPQPHLGVTGIPHRSNEPNLPATIGTALQVDFDLGITYRKIQVNQPVDVGAFHHPKSRAGGVGGRRHVAGVNERSREL